MATQSYANALGRVLATSNGATRYFSAAKAGDRLQGTAGNDFFTTVTGGATLAGGAGDDSYQVFSATDVVVEAAGEGIDTVTSYSRSYRLPDNVENLVVAGGSGLGNTLDNLLVASGTGSRTLNGGAGNDVLVGGTSTDRFVVAKGEGSDVIVNFTIGSDIVELDGFGEGAASFASIKAALRQVGGDALLDLGGGQSLTFRGVDAGRLDAGSFALPFSSSGLRMTFGDQFDALSASPLGAGTTWQSRYNFGRTLASNKEAEYYSDSSVGVDPFSVRDGVMTITASPAAVSGANELGLAYNSGVLTTSKSFAQQYGYFEMRAQLPAGQGFWPAFWLMPADGSWPPELDVVEMLGSDPTTIYATSHSGAGGTHTATSTPVFVADTSKGFHTYGLLWDAGAIRWYFDGNQVASTATPTDMNKPMYMIVNLAVGGAGSWPGAADGTSVGQMKVDYVRAYATASTVGASGASAQAVVPAAVSTVAPATSTVAAAATGGTAAKTASGPVALVLDGSGGTVARGDGAFTVTGPGTSGHVVLGNGNQVVSLTGAGNLVQAGQGNHKITLAGSGNTVTVGAGISVIDAGTSGARVSVGASSASRTTVKLAGANAVVTATGNGAVGVYGAGSNSRITLLDGNHDVSCTGSGSVVTLGNGASYVFAGEGGSAVVRTGSGEDRIRAGGRNNLLDGGDGNNFLYGGSGNDTFVMGAAGRSFTQVNGFTLTNKDVLDLTRTLAGAGLAGDLRNLSQFVTALSGNGGTTLLADVTGGHGTGVAFALLQGVTASVSDLIASHSLQVSGRLA